MANPIRTIHYGLGPIGCAMARLAHQRDDMKIVGGIDVDPKKVGQDIGMVAGIGSIGVSVVADPAAVLDPGTADIVIHSTQSYLKQTESQIATVLEAGLRVVSTCEELAYPWFHNPGPAEALDRLAKRHGTAVLGTGVNPGFVMDALAIAITAPCREVRRVRLERIVDAGKRRLPLQQKVGAGLTVAEFEARLAAGRVRHVGLPESAAMIAAALGWQIDALDERIEPVVAEKPARGEHISVPAGGVLGVRQVLRATRGSEELITMRLEMYLGAEDAHDAVYVDGVPEVKMVIPGGLHGDVATAAIVVNAIPRVLAARAGLWTMKDLPLVHR